jgi:Uma2 family endonuclease
MSITQPLVSVEEYMHSTYEPDAEYVEGRIVPRPMPKKPHSKMQRYLIRELCQVAEPLGYQVWPEQRVRCEDVFGGLTLGEAEVGNAVTRRIGVCQSHPFYA